MTTARGEYWRLLLPGTYTIRYKVLSTTLSTLPRAVHASDRSVWHAVTVTRGLGEGAVELDLVTRIKGQTLEQHLAETALELGQSGARAVLEVGLDTRRGSVETEKPGKALASGAGCGERAYRQVSSTI